jgi:hypothetical protein
MLNENSKSTDLQHSNDIPHVYGVVDRGLHIGGCFFIVEDIQFHSRYRASFAVGPGTVSTERIRVLTTDIKTITINSSQIQTSI